MNTKYQYKLRNVFLRNLRETIERSNPVDGDYELFVKSKFILEELGILISSLGGGLAPIKKSGIHLLFILFLMIHIRGLSRILRGEI